MEKLTELYGKDIHRNHETPFRHINSNGQVVNGFIDFIWETEDSFVIVDYKTCPGDHKQVFSQDSSHFAGRHGDQLNCYRQALEAAGTKKVAATIIYYPITRYMVEVK